MRLENIAALRSQCIIVIKDEGEESASNKPINFVSYTSRSFLTASTNYMSPRVRELSPKNMTSGKHDTYLDSSCLPFKNLAVHIH